MKLWLELSAEQKQIYVERWDSELDKKFKSVLQPAEQKTPEKKKDAQKIIDKPTSSTVTEDLEDLLHEFTGKAPGSKHFETREFRNSDSESTQETKR